MSDRVFALTAAAFLVIAGCALMLSADMADRLLQVAYPLAQRRWLFPALAILGNVQVILGVLLAIEQFRGEKP